MPTFAPSHRRPHLFATAKRAGRLCRAATVDLLFPPECYACREPLPSSAGGAFCPSCLSQVADNGPACRRCSAPVPEVAAMRSDCALCRKEEFPFASAVSLGPYRGALMELVLRVKHEAGAALALSLGALLAERVSGQIGDESVDLVVPLPMFWLRRLRRGTNPPDVLSEPVAERLAAPLALRALRFTRSIRQQSRLRPAERRVNVRHALAVTRAWDVSGAKIVLVDDVMTTGATCAEAAKTLLAAGAAKVWVGVVARGIGA